MSAPLAAPNKVLQSDSILMTLQFEVGLPLWRRSCWTLEKAILILIVA